VKGKLKLKYVDVKELRVDPRNRELFDLMDQHEIDLLAQSIKDHGLINPITITADNLIIAGEQRYRAARQVGFEQVPVIVRKPKDDLELEELRIDENLLRRNLPQYVYGKAFRRKVEIELVRQAQETKDVGDFQSENAEAPIIQRVASKARVGVTTGYRAYAIGNLIAELGELLDENKMSQETAFQLGQMSQADQKWLLSRLRASRLKEVKSQELQGLKAELNRARDANNSLQKLIDERNSTEDIRLKQAIKAKEDQMKVAIDKAKEDARKSVELLKEKYENYTKDISRKKREDESQPVYKLLTSYEKLLLRDATEVANSLHIVMVEIGEELARTSAELIPWLTTFEKAMRRRIREIKGTHLKGVSS
jgi:ParB family chromosome partitioning protein